MKEKLILHTNSSFKDELPTKCRIQYGKEVYSYTDFVAICYNPEKGKPELFMNADAITLGMAIQMLSISFHDAMGMLSVEDREMVSKLLKGE